MPVLESIKIAFCRAGRRDVCCFKHQTHRRVWNKRQMCIFFSDDTLFDLRFTIARGRSLWGTNTFIHTVNITIWGRKLSDRFWTRIYIKLTTLQRSDLIFCSTWFNLFLTTLWLLRNSVYKFDTNTWYQSTPEPVFFSFS